MDRFSWCEAELAARQQAGLLRKRRRCVPLPNGWCEVDGRRVRNFAGNDYLALADHPDVVAAAVAAVHETGVGSRASPLVCGRTQWHERLEQALAAFEGEDAAVLFPTGMAANIGTLTALMGPEDVVFCDRWNHASLVDGCRLSGATLRVYRHDDLEGLRKHFARATGFRRRYLVTDSIFSMEGDAAPLGELCDLAEEFSADVIVDEAHGTGVFGTGGRGVCELHGVQERVAVRIGTLSKAVGALGGFVAGPQSLIDYLWNLARTQMFSTALPPAVCAAACAALRIISEDSERRRTLLRNCDEFRRRLEELGLPALAGSMGPIVPIVIGDPGQTLALSKRLEERGLLVGAIRPPTVPQGSSRLRISLSVAHESDDLKELARAVVEEFHGLQLTVSSGT